ncbi:16856_t:CDS:1 [Gigaspora margarita]|uniref:16856_t:CDS:1 n=1 Tax=Gigaspora margarita TaxID=4874 RepID=A0ABN7WAU9_GIGMA|nr:16856_t:CDS:1 [Gigaspora margarita]
MEQNLLVLVYVNKIDQIKNVNDAYAFEHFVKKLYPNVGKFEEFNMQSSKDNSILYSLNITSENFLNSKYNFAERLRTSMTYINVNILFILIKNHEHVSHMEELLGDVIITIDPIDDISFKYQSDNIQEFTTILRKFNPQNILNICEKHRIATIYDKTSLNLYCNVKKNIKVKKREIIEYRTKLTQEEINILLCRYLKAGSYIKKLKDGEIENYIHQIKYFNDKTHKMIEETVREVSNVISTECERQCFFKANLSDYILKSIKTTPRRTKIIGNNLEGEGIRESPYIIKSTPRRTKIIGKNLKGKGTRDSPYIIN